MWVALKIYHKIDNDPERADVENTVNIIAK